MITEKFYNTVKKYNMFTEGDSVVAAVSGGADSVCLFSLLLLAREEMGIKVNCAHVNHNLRKTAKRDEDFVRRLCEKNGVHFFLYSADVFAISKETGESVEVCGRNERYKFFFEVAKKTGSRAVLTAHNKNDSAETVLLNLIRGSGARGLRGIKPVREDGVARPLIEITREEIEEYLKKNNISYMEDETNKDEKYTRNFVRLKILPVMKELNPSVTEAVCRLSNAVAEDDDFISGIAERTGGIKIESGRVEISIEAISGNPPPIAKRIIMAAFIKAEIEPTFSDIEAVLSLSGLQTGKKHVFPCGKVALKGYESIIIEKPHEKNEFCYKLVPEEEVYIKETGKRIIITRQKPQGKHIKIKYCDGEFSVRSRREGDKFSPTGLKGTKKLKDYFIDEKILQSEKWKIPVILCEGRIAAVGDRVDQSFAVDEGEAALYIIIR